MKPSLPSRYTDVLRAAVFASLLGWPAVVNGQSHSDHDAGSPTATTAPATHGNHGDMRAPGGDAPADARDPHAYSDGHRLGVGPYALPGPRQLHMADEHPFWGVLADRLEYDAGNEAAAYDLRAHYGSTYDRATLRLEGELDEDTLEESRSELYWSHAVSAYFDRVIGLRHDGHEQGPERDWLGVGFSGLAPYWFELDGVAWLGEHGRSALWLEAEYELLLTQSLILQPRAEINLYGRDDDANGLGSGLADSALGLRLRYEFTRQFAPYVGVEWLAKYGDTADHAREDGEPVHDTVFVIGLRAWY